MPYVVKKPQRETAATSHFPVLILVPAFYHTPPGAQLSAHLCFHLLFCCLPCFPGYDVQMFITPSFLRETPTYCPVSPRKAPVQLLPLVYCLCFHCSGSPFPLILSCPLSSVGEIPLPSHLSIIATYLLVSSTAPVGRD